MYICHRNIHQKCQIFSCMIFLLLFWKYCCIFSFYDIHFLFLSFVRLQVFHVTLFSSYTIISAYMVFHALAGVFISFLLLYTTKFTFFHYPYTLSFIHFISIFALVTFQSVYQWAKSCVFCMFEMGFPKTYFAAIFPHLYASLIGNSSAMGSLL